eukprot:XP_001699183.1 predicted protein [Chlamydomonas reinhardtii]
MPPLRTRAAGPCRGTGAGPLRLYCACTGDEGGRGSWLYLLPTTTAAGLQTFRLPATR